MLGFSPADRVQVLITDDADAANGSATSLPFDTIRLYAEAPDDLSPLSEYDDWLTTLIRHEHKNLVVNVGLQYMAGAALTSTAQITSWYVGLYGSGATNSPAAGNTMSSHGTWTEVTDYSESTRVLANFAAATNANPSVVTNTSNKAVFTINGTTVVGGAFLTSDSTKRGTTGALFSAADFISPGDRSVV